jgi:putative ABC transport system substrate-binding protein
MRRREFVALVGRAGVVSPLLRPRAGGAQSAMPVIGILNPGSPDLVKNLLAAFRNGLGETGYMEGRNVATEYRWAEGQNDRMPELAADLVRRRVAVIVTNGNGSRIAKAATSTIPIVFTTGADPVEQGLIASLNRPGGNLTGASNMGDVLGPKRLELLRELMPAAARVGFLDDPTNGTSEPQSRDIQAAARALGLEVNILRVRAERDFDAAFETMVRQRVGGLVIATSPLFNNNSQMLAALAQRHALPSIYQYRDFAAAGGLMSYGGVVTDVWRLMGVYAGRILKGEKAADLPFQRTTKVELIINMKTAKALGLTFPITLLGRADEVIE